MSEYHETEHDESMQQLHTVDETHKQLTRLRAQRDAKAMLAAEEAGKTPVRLGRRTMADLVAQATEELEVRHEYGAVGFSTGIPELDEKLGGALQPGRVVGVAADTKSGKTTFGGNLAVSFASQGVPLLLGSFEDQHTDTVFRYLANLTSTNVGVIRSGFRTRSGEKLAIPADFDDGADKLAALGIEVIDRAGTVEQIAYEAKDWMDQMLASAHEYGVVILDQLSHFIPSNPVVFAQRFPGYPPPPSSGAQRDMMVWQVQMLTRIAKRLNVLIVVMMQMTLAQNRYEKPSHHDLREAKAAAFEMDALLIPWRPAKLRNESRGLGEPEFVDNDTDRTWILCPIGRQVQSFEVEVTWDGAHQRFLPLGTDTSSPWGAPERPSEKSVEGFRKLAELRSRWDERATARLQAANGGPEVALDAPERRQLARPGAAHPAPAAPVTGPARPLPPKHLGTGFGGKSFG